MTGFTWAEILKAKSYDRLKEWWNRHKKGQDEEHQESQPTKEQLEALKQIVENDDPYDILGIDKSADTPTLIKAYRKLSKLVHPDRNPSPGATEATKKLNDAKKAIESGTVSEGTDQKRHKKTNKTRRSHLNPKGIYVQVCGSEEGCMTVNDLQAALVIGDFVQPSLRKCALVMEMFNSVIVQDYLNLHDFCTLFKLLHSWHEAFESFDENYLKFADELIEVLGDVGLNLPEMIVRWLFKRLAKCRFDGVAKKDFIVTCAKIVTSKEQFQELLTHDCHCQRIFLKAEDYICLFFGLPFETHDIDHHECQAEQDDNEEENAKESEEPKNDQDDQDDASEPDKDQDDQYDASEKEENAKESEEPDKDQDGQSDASETNKDQDDHDDASKINKDQNDHDDTSEEDETEPQSSQRNFQNQSGDDGHDENQNFEKHESKAEESEFFDDKETEESEKSESDTIFEELERDGMLTIEQLMEIFGFHEDAVEILLLKFDFGKKGGVNKVEFAFMFTFVECHRLGFDKAFALNNLDSPSEKLVRCMHVRGIEISLKLAEKLCQKYTKLADLKANKIQDPSEKSIEIQSSLGLDDVIVIEHWMLYLDRVIRNKSMKSNNVLAFYETDFIVASIGLFYQ